MGVSSQRWKNKCVGVFLHLIHNWSLLAEAPVRDPSPPQVQGPNAAASPTQMDLSAGGCPCGPHCPSPTDGVSQCERRFTSIPIKAWPALAVTFRRFVFLGWERHRVFLCVFASVTEEWDSCANNSFFFHCRRLCLCIHSASGSERSSIVMTRNRISVIETITVHFNILSV